MQDEIAPALLAQPEARQTKTNLIMQNEITAEYLQSQGRYEKFPSRFWKKVVKTDSCWLWTGSKTVFGYGVIGIGKHYGYKNLGAHVASWILHNGQIPKGLCVLHNCPGGDNPACVNPAHLWIGTKKQNTNDMVKKGRGVFGNTFGERNSHSKLTEDDVRKIRKLYAERPMPRKKGGKGYARMAREFGVTDTLIKFIVTRRIWKHI